MTDPQFAASTRRESVFRVSVIGVFVAVTLTWLVSGLFEAPLVPDNFTNSYSGSPGGHQALVTLMRQNGRSVRSSATGLHLPALDASSGDTLMLLEPRPRFMDEYSAEVEQLFTDVREVHSSVVLALPKRAYESAYEDEQGQLVLRESIHPMSEKRALLARTGLQRWFSLEYDTRERVAVRAEGPNSRRTADCEFHEPVQVLRPTFDMRNIPAELDVIARTDRNDVIAVRWRVDPSERYGGLVLVSDPDLFANKWLGEQGMADAAMLMLDFAPPNGAVIVDELLHGFGADASLEYLAATPPGLWLSLSVFLLLALFGWRQATVLRPVAAEMPDRASRRYAIEGLARMLRRVGDHIGAARRIQRRSIPVLDESIVTVHEAGKVLPVAMARVSGRMTLRGADQEEQLISVAREIAEQKRTGQAADIHTL